jgi:hypothetical protein
MSFAGPVARAQSPTPADCEGAGRATPEAAAQLYLEGLQSVDLAKMLSAFAVETYVDCFDFAAHLESTGVYSPEMTIAYPNVNSLFRDINVESRRQEIVSRIKMQMMSLVGLSVSGFNPTPAPFQAETADTEIPSFVERFQDGLGDVAFQQLQFTGFVSPSLLSALYSDEKLRQNMARQAAILGADELQSVVASFSVHGKQYLFCCNALRYGEKWYLESLGGHIAQLLGLSVRMGGIMPIK